MSIQYKLKFPSIFQICLVCLFFHSFFQKWYWYWILILQFFWHTDTDTYSVFFRLNTGTDTSVFKNHTVYWILVFSFCTGQVSELNINNLVYRSVCDFFPRHPVVLSQKCKIQCYKNQVCYITFFHYPFLIQWNVDAKSLKRTL